MVLSQKTRSRTVLTLGWLVSLALALSVGLTKTSPAKGPQGASSEESASHILPAIKSLKNNPLFHHLAELGVDRWQAKGYQGQGMKVAILDTGFRGYREHLGKELPQNVTVRSFRADGNLEARDSQHGILCGEVIHTLAPGAELLLANWDTESPDEFLAAVGWARREGARVISCSVITPDWSDGEGGGAIHQAMAQILGPGNQPGDALCFASAGNTAERHWFGRFQAGKDGFHEWKKGQEDNILTPWGDEPVMVELYCSPETSYDVYVYDVTTKAEVGHATTARDHKDRHYAVVQFNPQSDHLYEARVRLAGGVPGEFHLVALSSDSLSYATPRGSISFPADGTEVIAMGAVDDEGHRLAYSSCGPNSPDTKPDFVALGSVPSSFRDRPFGGTSAAAPQGAAMAALWWSHYPDWTANKVEAALRASAHVLGPKGDAWETGYGEINLPKE